MYNPLNPEHLVYQVSPWEALQWEDYTEAHAEAQAALTAGKKKVYSFGQFATEVFHRLYAVEPQPVGVPKPEAAWAVNAHQQLSTLAEFDELRTTIEVEATGDSFKKWHLSGVGATKFSQEVAESFLQPPQALLDPQPLRDQIYAVQQRLKELLAEAQQQDQIQRDSQVDAQQRGEAGEKIRQLNPQIIDCQQQIEAITTQGKKAVAKARKYAERLDPQLPEVLQAAVSAAQTEVEKEIMLLKAFSWGDKVGQRSQGGSYSDKLDLAQRVAQNPKLVAIAQLVGRMKLMAAKQQRTKMKERPTSIYGVETGRELTRLLPSELVKLAVPQLRPLFLQDYAQQTLLQYQLGSKQPLGQGPVVVCLDSSGSMAGAKEQWSKAVAIALLSIAHEQKRTCRLLHFTKKVVRVDDFPKGELDPFRLVDCMDAFYNGGTSWEAPLDSALDIIRQEQAYRHADIILITDEQCRVSSSWLKQFHQAQRTLEFGTYGVMLGTRDTEALAQILDTVIALPNLQQDTDIEVIFGI